MTVCPAINPYGVDWQGDDIVFGQGPNGIMRVSANGGKPEPVLTGTATSADGVEQQINMFPAAGGSSGSG